MKRWVFAFAAVVLSFVVCVSLFLLADTWAHYRYDDQAGLNRRGYRGPIVGAKHGPRAIALGDSTVLGYGLHWSDAWPAQLQTLSGIEVVNLAYNNEGAYATRFVLEDFRSLHSDIAILAEGYNDAFGGQINRMVARRQSAVFRLTGYFPLLPMVVGEKIMALRQGGDLRAAYRGDKVVFRPPLRARATADALDTALQLSNALAENVGRLSPDNSNAKGPSAAESEKIAAYCDDMLRAIDTALSQGQRVIVVTQPFAGPPHERQQAALTARLATLDDRVQYVNLGHAIDLHDRTLSWDGSHLTPEGNRIMAQALVAPLRKAMAHRTTF